MGRIIRGYSVDASSPVRSVVLRIRDVYAFVYCPVYALLLRRYPHKVEMTPQMLRGKVAHEARVEFGRIIVTGRMREMGTEVVIERVVGDLLPRFSPPLSRLEVEEIVREVFEGFSKVLDEYGVPRSADFEVPLRSERLSLVGVIDSVEEGVPVEFKYMSREPGDPEMVQLALYALLMEDRMGVDVDVGYVEDLRRGKRMEVEIGECLRERALRARDDALRVLFTGISVRAERRRRRRCEFCDVRVLCRLIVPRGVRV
ncbi:MAG: Dna2/Cas4 domain-containing protein [Candidatus Baldrarchaeia archaeon]